jgi:hypothetical protein
MPVTMVQVECPCCGRSVEVILVGTAHYEDEVEPAPKRKRRSKTQEAFERGSPDFGGQPGLADVDGTGHARAPQSDG